MVESHADRPSKYRWIYDNDWAPPTGRLNRKRFLNGVRVDDGVDHPVTITKTTPRHAKKKDE